MILGNQGKQGFEEEVMTYCGIQMKRNMTVTQQI